MNSRTNNLIIYDGHCGLCNRFVRFVLRFDKKGKFTFTEYQSAYASELLARKGIHYTGEPQTVYLYFNNQLYERSNAAIKVLSSMGGMWKLSILFYAVPRVLRDFLYDQIANKRFTFFGRVDSCMYISEEQHSRFIP